MPEKKQIKTTAKDKEQLKEKKTFDKRSGTVEIIAKGKSKNLVEGKTYRVGLEVADILVKKGEAKAK